MADHNVKDELVLYGNVDVRQVDLAFRVGGRVKTFPYEEGDLVAPGTLVATLDDEPYNDKVREALAALEAARVSLSNAKLVWQRRVQLLKQNAVSVEEYENAISGKDVAKATVKERYASLQTAKTNLNDTKLFAPTAGTILTRIREPGSVLAAGEPLCTLTILTPVWVRAYVAEPQLGSIFPGMPAEIYTDSQGVYRGQVGFISPVAEFTPKTVQTTQLRTDLVYRIRVVVDNPDHGLRQGMPVTVRLKA